MGKIKERKKLEFFSMVTNSISRTGRLIFDAVSERQNNASFRIVSGELKAGKIILAYQVTGTRVVGKATPEEIFSDKKFLSGFNAMDSSRITELALTSLKDNQENDQSADLNQACYSLKTSYLASASGNNDMIILYNKETGEELEISAESVSNDQDILSKINAIDANKVGQIAGESIAHRKLKKIFNWRAKN